MHSGPARRPRSPAAQAMAAGIAQEAMAGTSPESAAAIAPGTAAGIGPVVAGSPFGEPVDATPQELELDGPSGIFRVWLGDSRDPGALEADVRAVCDSGVPRPAVAVALGEVARRHKLEVRVIPRVDDRGELLLVVFGARVPGSRR